MSERKPVMCPWCKLRGVDSLMEPVACYGADGESGYYWCRKCDSRSSRARNTKSAYHAATRRPENRALTRKQMKCMPEMAALWKVDASDMVSVHSVKYTLSYKPWSSRTIYFASIPSPDDIARAREERENDHT